MNAIKWVGAILVIAILLGTPFGASLAKLFGWIVIGIIIVGIIKWIPSRITK